MIQLVREILQNLPMWTPLSMLQTAACLAAEALTGAIHRAAGPELLFECRLLGGCKTGQAKLTKSIPAAMQLYYSHGWVPVWNGGSHNEDRLLADCYHNSLKLAAEHGIKRIAFPSISTGSMHFQSSGQQNCDRNVPGSFCRKIQICLSRFYGCCLMKRRRLLIRRRCQMGSKDSLIMLLGMLIVGIHTHC